MEYLYFTIVSISTVGYGDISPITLYGRIVVSFIIIGAIGYLVTHLDESMKSINVIKNKIRYSIDNIYYPPRLVITGIFTDLHLENFLSDFLHPDRNNSRYDIVIL